VAQTGQDMNSFVRTYHFGCKEVLVPANGKTNIDYGTGQNDAFKANVPKIFRSLMPIMSNCPKAPHMMPTVARTASAPTPGPGLQAKPNSLATGTFQCSRSTILYRLSANQRRDQSTEYLA